MRNKTISNLIQHLENVLSENLTLTAYAEKHGLPTNYFWVKRECIYDGYVQHTISEEIYNKVNTLYKQAKVKPKDRGCELKFKDTETDDTSKVEIIRDENGKIEKYTFISYIRGKEPLSGNFDRNEMNLIYRLYSNYGSGITQREVSRFFPEYSLEDFKRILRAFNITKASAPFAPHIFEENDKDTLLNMQFREKENDFLRTYEAEKVKFTENQLKKYMKENQDLKDQLGNFSNILKDINLSNLPKFSSNLKTNSRDLIIWLSDMHVGATVSGYSIYSNPYDENEITNRLETLFQRLEMESQRNGGFNNIVVCNIGDSLDGYNAQTTRGGHTLEQNMNNKEQLSCFIRVMTTFMKNIAEYLPCTSLSYYCVGESNHDGDFGYSANIALSFILKSMNIQATVFEKFIGEFKLGETTYILCHGKDNKDMFKNFPLTLDIKTENYINEYLDTKGIKGNVVFVKGDLHQSAVTYGRRFTYKSVGSLFGSSEWIHKNFGNTPACVDYSIVDNDNMLDGRIVL